MSDLTVWTVELDVDFVPAPAARPVDVAALAATAARAGVSALPDATGPVAAPVAATARVGAPVAVTAVSAGPRAVPVRSLDPLRDALPDRIITGRVALVDCRAADFLGQDTSAGDINPSSVTISDAARADLASVGFAYFAAQRSTTKTGQSVIADLVARNPDFVFYDYLHFSHVPTSDPGLARPLDSWKATNLPPALDLDGNPVRAWPAPPDPVEFYWQDILTGAGPGETFDRDTLAAYVDEYHRLVMANAHRPIGVKCDYFNPVSSGFFVWPGETAVDLDQDGVPYASDAEEQAALRDAQQFFVDYLRTKFGADFIITGNGLGSWPAQDTGLESRLNGLYLEGFPTTPWFGPADAFQTLFDLSSGVHAYAGFQGRSYFFHTDVRPVWDLNSTVADASRCAALLFDGWYRYRPLDGTGAVVEADIVDETWNSWIASLGAPTAAAVRSESAGFVLYSRTFSGGSVVVQIDPAQSGLAQIQFAGLV